MVNGVKQRDKVIHATESVAEKTVYPILLALGFTHLLNDIFQSLIPAMYPLIKESYELTFAQVGIITMTYQLVASVLQPVIGWYTDQNPKIYALSLAMSSTATGLVFFGLAINFFMVLIGVALIGFGSSIFHPESSRVAHFASGGRKGMAQSIFQVGGRVGTSMGPLLAAFIILPLGRTSTIWFGAVAVLGAFLLAFIGRWYNREKPQNQASSGQKQVDRHIFSVSSFSIPRSKAIKSLTILMVLTLSKYAYLACMRNYLTFYMIQQFGVSAQASQIYLFIFLFSVAL